MAMVFRVALADLQPGAGGEVVLFNDSAFRDMVLESVTGRVETGVVRSHVTAEGIDVSGFHFLKFENGMVVFHTSDTSVQVEIG